MAPQPISLAEKLMARLAAAARKTVAKRTRPAVRKARRTHKRRIASKTFDL
jgi:hypothetical protein